MTLQDKVVSLNKVVHLRADVAHLQTENGELRRQLTVAVARLAQVEQQDKPPSAKSPPSFVKPNRPKRDTPNGQRKKRATKHNTSRRRAKPTCIERHAVDRCPVCDYRFTGESIDYIRQAIEIPPPVEITEHQVVKRWCPHCEACQSPHLDLSQQVMGQGRIGLRIARVVSYLRTALHDDAAYPSILARHARTVAEYWRDHRVAAPDDGSNRAGGR